MTDLIDAAASREHNCQTPECLNDYVVITVDVESSDTMFHCRGCWLAFALAVAQTMHEAGLLPDVRSNDDDTSGQVTTPVV